MLLAEANDQSIQVGMTEYWWKSQHAAKSSLYEKANHNTFYQAVNQVLTVLLQ